MTRKKAILAVLVLLAVSAVGASVYWFIQNDPFNIFYQPEEDATTSLQTRQTERALPLVHGEYEVRINGLYHRERLVEPDIDIPSFEFLEGMYAKDKNKVYAFNVYGAIGSSEAVDVATFKVIAGKYAKDKRNVYYGTYSGIKNIEPVDIDTFIVLSEEEKGYARDAKRIYYGTTEIPEADILSFEVLGGAYSKDARSVYFENTKVEGADPGTFRLFAKSRGFSVGIDATHVYRSGQIIPEFLPQSLQLVSTGENEPYLDILVLKNDSLVYFVSEYNIHLVQGADPKTFQMFPRGFYGKDNMHLYFFSYYAEPEIIPIIVDLDSLEFISHDYYTDKDRVYYLTTRSDIYTPATAILEGVDPTLFKQTFHVFGLCVGLMYSGDDYYIAYDTSVYCGKRKLAGADARTFEIVGAYNFYNGRTMYARDAHFAYEGGKMLNGVDGSTFRVFNSSAYTADKGSVYIEGSVIEEADVDTFELIYHPRIDDLRIAKDKNHVYKDGEVIKEADVRTFEWIGDTESESAYYAKDKNHAYFLGEPIEGSDPATFIVIVPWIAKDSAHVYEYGELVEGANPSACTRDNLKGCKEI